MRCFSLHLIFIRQRITVFCRCITGNATIGSQRVGTFQYKFQISGGIRQDIHSETLSICSDSRNLFQKFTAWLPWKLLNTVLIYHIIRWFSRTQHIFKDIFYWLCSRQGEVIPLLQPPTLFKKSASTLLKISFWGVRCSIYLPVSGTDPGEKTQ